MSSLLLNESFGTFYRHAQVEPYINSLWVVIIISITAIIFVNGYKTSIGILPSIDEILKVFIAMSVSVILIVWINFFWAFIPGSRYVLFYFLITSTIIIGLFRCVILWVEMTAYSKGIGSKRSLIIGSSPLAQDIAERMVLYPMMGYQYIGSIDDALPNKIHYHLKDQFKLLGTLGSLETVVHQYNIESVFMTSRDLSQFQFRRMVTFCNDNNVQFNLLSEPILNNLFMDVSVFDGFPMLSVGVKTDVVLYKIMKRIFDIVFSVCLIILASPIMMITGAWIKWVSPEGSIIFRQERVGQFGKVFKIFKFRSMLKDAEKDSGPVMVSEKGEKRYIKGGQFIRQYSLDELPQLFNVLIGDMSIVGPRPERPYFVEKFSKAIPFFDRRHNIPVGITGWAQINGRSVLTRRPEQKIKYDIYYMNQRSLFFDLKILIKTIIIVLTKRESY